jgi:hypothetical protein
MPRHDDLLEQGPREAPEPETVEQRSQKLGLKSAGGVVAGGGVVAAKAGVLAGFGKFFVWIFFWNSLSSAWRIGGWIGLAVVLAVVGAWLALRHRRQAAA